MVWTATFYVCFSANQGSTGGFLLLQYFSGAVRHLRDLQGLNTLFLLSSYLLHYRLYVFVIYLLPMMIHVRVEDRSSGPSKCVFTKMEAEDESWDPVKLG